MVEKREYGTMDETNAYEHLSPLGKSLHTVGS